MSNVILSANNLSKHYKGVAAVNNLSMTINKGDIYGLVGLNGSGKTTLIRLITSLIKPTSGSFTLFGGQDSNVSALSRISSMVETPSIYMNLSAIDNMKVQCSIATVTDPTVPEKLLRLVGLEKTGKKLAKNFSLGMRQRLGIAIALVGDPEFLILDEPTNGLDPEGIIEIRELLQKLNRELGITIMVSSHILFELSKLAKRFGFIHKGVLIKETTAAEIAASVKSRLNVEVDNMPLALAALEGEYYYEVRDGILSVDCDLPLSDFVDFMKSKNVKVMSATKVTQDLESYFINLIKGEAK